MVERFCAEFVDPNPNCSGFYRTTLCCICFHRVSLCLSVRLSVTSRCFIKTAKRTIRQTTPYASPGTLVFCCQRYRRNYHGVTLNEGVKYRWNRLKSVANFDQYFAISQKQYIVTM